MNFSEKNYFLIFILITLLLEAVFFYAGNQSLDNAFLKEEKNISEMKMKFNNFSMEAKAVSIYDNTLNKKIYGRYDDIPMPIASLTKIMTVVTALNGHNMDDPLFISENALRQESNYGFYVNEKFKIGDLAKFTLIGSANDGAYALAENVEDFLGKMNRKAQKIGMEKALFLNPTGLDIDVNRAGAYSTAEDVNILAMYALNAYREVFSASIMPEIRIKSLSGFEHDVKNTDIILDKIPNILFSKTGFSSLAQGNLTIIYKSKNEHIISITVLGSTEKGRFTDMQNIVNILEN